MKLPVAKVTIDEPICAIRRRVGPVTKMGRITDPTIVVVSRGKILEFNGMVTILQAKPIEISLEDYQLEY